MNECLLTPQHESEKKTTIVKHLFNDTLDTFVLTIIFMSEIILQQNILVVEHWLE